MLQTCYKNQYIHNTKPAVYVPHKAYTKQYAVLNIIKHQTIFLANS